MSAIAWYRYLSQDAIWRDADGAAHRISDMTELYRRNCARWLERRAERLAAEYTIGEHLLAANTVFGEAAQEALDDALETGARVRNMYPLSWMQVTPLYKALMAGLVPETEHIYRPDGNGKVVQF
jgi:hypothetical protein